MFADPDFDGDSARITEEKVNVDGETTATTEAVPEGQEPETQGTGLRGQTVISRVP